MQAYHRHGLPITGRGQPAEQSRRKKLCGGVHPSRVGWGTACRLISLQQEEGREKRTAMSIPVRRLDGMLGRSGIPWDGCMIYWHSMGCPWGWIDAFVEWHLCFSFGLLFLLCLSQISPSVRLWSQSLPPARHHPSLPRTPVPICLLEVGSGSLFTSIHIRSHIHHSRALFHRDLFEVEQARPGIGIISFLIYFLFRGYFYIHLLRYHPRG